MQHNAKLAILVLILFCFFFSGCNLLGIKPFQLDINVNFDEKTATLIGTDSSGRIVYNQKLKKEGTQWQKSMALYSP